MDINMNPALIQRPTPQANAANINSTARQQIKDTARQFEEFYIYQSLELMKPDISDDPIIGGGAAERMFQPMLNEFTAKEIAKSGGIGLAPHIEAKMIEIQENLQ